MIETSSTLRPCPDCGQSVSTRAVSCPKCGGPLWRKSTSEAFFSARGFGVIDLIPGIRDLPYAARFVLVLIMIGVLALLIVPVVVRLLVPVILGAVAT